MLRNRSLARAPHRRARLAHRLLDDVRRAAVVRARDDGLDGEDGLGPRRRDAADRDLRHPRRLAHRPARREADDARLRRGARAAHARAPDPPPHGAPLVRARSSAPTFAIGVFAAPYFASLADRRPGGRGRGRARGRRGERDPRRARTSSRSSPARCSQACSSPRRAPSTVLVVDACTYVFSFLTIAARRARRQARRSRRRVARASSPASRFLMRDRLLGPIMLAACVINFVAQGLIVGVQGARVLPLRRATRTCSASSSARSASARSLGALVAQQLARRGRPAEARRVRDRRDAAAALPARGLDAVGRGARRRRGVRVLRAARERADHRHAHGAHARRRCGRR